MEAALTFFLMRLPDVEKACGLKKSSIYDRIKRQEFPAPYRLGNGHHVAWRSDEVADWIASLPRVENGSLIGKG